MTALRNPGNSTADVVMIVHVYVKGYKREGSFDDLVGAERNEEELKAFDKNWHLSRRIEMPYSPRPGTRISFPVAPEDARTDNLLDAARGLGIPRLGITESSALLVVSEVTFWVGDGIHAECEVEAPDEKAARNF